MNAKPIPALTVEDLERFWSKVEVKPNGCWEWTGGKAHGYGRFRLGRALFFAHRISFLVHNGKEPIPKALHTCDNPPCCNPEHLFQGTQNDNVHDCMAKGRRRHFFGRRVRGSGEEHPFHKLTWAVVDEIRKRYGELTGRQLAKQYGVAGPTIMSVVRGKSWRR